MCLVNQKIDTSVIQSKQVIEMITVANEFCLFVEDIEKFEFSYVCEYLQRVLPLLYIKGSLIPLTEPNQETDNERYVIEESWEYIFNTVKNIFGQHNLYYFWNPGITEAESTTVAENMADMYQDLKDFVFLFSKPSHYAKVNAVYMCRTLFVNSWGKKTLTLMNHLHYVHYDKNQNTEDDDE